MVEFAIIAEARDDLGKGSSRRLRRNADRIPAIIYGGDKAPKSISVQVKELNKLIEDESAFSHIIDLTIGKQKEKVLIKALQRHPSKGSVMHIDFLRVMANVKLTTTIALTFINEDIAVGVKASGGEIAHMVSEVEISCLPKDLPATIEVDLANVGLNDMIHLSDLKVPAGVELVALTHDNNMAVATIVLPHDQTANTEDDSAPEQPAAE